MPILVAVWLHHPSAMLIIIAILALPQLKKAWKYDAKVLENIAYYGVKTSTRFEYGALYIMLIVVLASMIESISVEGIR